MVQVDVIYEGGLRARAVHGPSGCELVTDAPVDNHGKGESFSPTDLVATALATCAMTIMGIAARREGFSIDGSSCHIEKHMTADPPRRIGSLPLHFKINADLDATQRKALEDAARSCPVTLSIHPEIDAPVTFSYPDPS